MRSLRPAHWPRRRHRSYLQLATFLPRHGIVHGLADAGFAWRLGVHDGSVPVGEAAGRAAATDRRARWHIMLAAELRIQHACPARVRRNWAGPFFDAGL